VNPVKAALGLLGALWLLSLLAGPAAAQVAVKGKTIHTLDGPAIEDGMVIIRDGKIASIGKASDLKAPDGFRLLEAAVVVPGLVDAHSVVGLSGLYNYQHDREQLEGSAPVQPELRAIDAYNPQDPLVAWVRSFGVTTVHTGHAPGELISGQTMVVKTRGATVEDAVLVPARAVAVTLGSDARKEEKKSPGTRGKMMSMLREALVRAREYVQRRAAAEEEKRPQKDLALEVLADVLARKVPLLVTAQRAQDIASALRLREEFEVDIILDGAAEAYLLAERIKAAGVPVIVHPTMARASGDLENMSFETAARLRAAGILAVLQSGYETYVPKARVVLFEAAIAAANGLSFEDALRAITIDAARVLGVDGRVGSLTVGKDGDLALFDGDPFEYTTHCVGVVIEGEVVSTETR
jgi:imidazolonepropionase-like amidohydrolase